MPTEMVAPASDLLGDLLKCEEPPSQFSTVGFNMLDTSVF